MPERTYAQSRCRPPEIEHRYGSNVHLVDDPLALAFVGRLGSPECQQPEVGRILRLLYQHLSWAAIAAEFPRETVERPTRMARSSPGAAYRGVSVARHTQVVTVGIARAGTVPSQICYELLNEILDPGGVRQDHLTMSRQVDAAGRVTGSAFNEAKVGGEVGGRILLLPDPMGATGSSISEAVRYYKGLAGGPPVKILSMQLIVTPEFIRRVTGDHPDVVLYALRLDRGLSSPEVLDTVPGTAIERERGLDDRQYIVPGAGGLGEILNNAWI